MYPTYLPIIIYALFSVFMPASIILTSFVLRNVTKSNPVKSSAFESAEQSKGTRISIMNEYIHYFPMFISFEIIAAITLIWILAARAIPFTNSMFVLGLMLLGFVSEFAIIMLARSA